MHTPDHYKVTDQNEILAFIGENGFGVLITQLNGIPYATNIPMVIEKTEEGNLIINGHISKENPQAESFIDGSRALAVFNGPHAYISSSWYNHENVSTWNYVSAQASGILKRMDELEVVESLIKLTNKYEAKEKRPRFFENISAKVIRENLTGVAGFRIHIDSLQASRKLSQNRDDADHRTIIEELRKRGDASSADVAEEMKKQRPSSIL